MPPSMNPTRGPRGPRHTGGIKHLSKEGRQTILRLIRMVVKDYKWSLLVVVACTFITPVATLSSTLFTKTLIDDYIIPLTQAAQPDYTPLVMAIGKLAVILTAGALCAYLQSRLMINVSQGTLLRLRRDTFSHMQQLPVNYFDQHAHGDIMSVYTNDIDTLRQMISTLPNIFSSVVTIVITFASMIVLSWPLTLLTVIMSVIMMYTTRKLGNISASHFRRQQQSLGELNGFVEEMLTGQKVVKTFCHEESAIEQFSRLNDQLRDSACNANRVANIVMPVNGNLSNLIYVMAAIFGAMLALNYFSPATTQGLAVSITIGTLVSFLTLIKNFTRPVSEISNQINSVINAVAGADRVFAILDAPEEKDDDDADIRLVSAQLKDGVITESKEKTNIWAWKDSKGNYTRQQGEVDFFGVDFAYPPALDSKQPPKQVLFDITLDTEAGQKIAIVGGTGAGKTTIINLINRFYDIQNGVINYDQLPIRRICKADLRRSLGIVLQETHLFTGTVMENIRYGRLDATDEECIEAAKLVNADDFIRRLANGYQTVLTSDGGNLSQGERQLLAIARAAVANPPALILDEATSSIDTRTEQMVQRGMDSIMKGRSTFVIAHRLSTIRNADMIIVMDHGRIIERGTHSELLAHKGKYYQLYTGNQIN